MVTPFSHHWRPGLIQTVLSEYYWKDEARLRERLATQPIKHLGQPEEIAEIAVMLASDKASYLTGQVITVDGGATLAYGPDRPCTSTLGFRSYRLVRRLPNAVVPIRLN